MVSSISPTEERSPNGVEATVKLYVRSGNMSALTEQKLQRLKLLTQHKDTSDFSFRLLREHCEKDIAALDAGIRELLQREPSRGYVDIYLPEKIAGWAQYLRYPEIPVKLAIYFDHELAGQIVASLYRRDLEQANVGSGRHAFEFVPPKELFLDTEVIEVKAPDGTVIGAYKRETSTPPIKSAT